MSLPSQVLITFLTHCYRELACFFIIGRSIAICPIVVVLTNLVCKRSCIQLVVTYRTIANLQLQKVNPLNILQEIFLVHLPSQTDTSESTPTMTRGKCRRSITTKRGIYKVFVCIIIHYTTEETFCHIVICERIVLLLACTKCITQLTNEWIVKTGI